MPDSEVLLGHSTGSSQMNLHRYFGFLEEMVMRLRAHSCVTLGRNKFVRYAGLANRYHVTHIPDDRLGSSQVLPAQGPPFSGSVASRISTVATINLSATGSRNAPNAEVVFCTNQAWRYRDCQVVCHNSSLEAGQACGLCSPSSLLGSHQDSL